MGEDKGSLSLADVRQAAVSLQTGEGTDLSSRAVDIARRLLRGTAAHLFLSTSETSPVAPVASAGASDGQALAAAKRWVEASRESRGVARANHDDGPWHTMAIPLLVWGQWRGALVVVRAADQLLFADQDEDAGALLALHLALALDAHELRGRAAVAEDTVRDNKADTRSIVEGALDGIVTVGGDGLVVDWNPAAAALFGIQAPEALGRPFSDFLDADDADPLEMAMELARKRTSAPVRRLEFMAHSRQGTCIPVELSLSPLTAHQSKAIAVFVRDVSEEKRLAFDLREAQKLESVGRLAAGVAHEINTPIQFVSDSIVFIREAIDTLLQLQVTEAALIGEFGDGSGAPELAEKLKQAESDADLQFLVENVPRALLRCTAGLGRITAIVRSMKAFAHPPEDCAKLANINQAITDTLTIAVGEYRLVADVKTDLGDLPMVECFISELNQAFLNIIVNAAHAIGDVVAKTGEKGLICVRSFLDESDVVVAIADTGGGIPDEIRPKIFEPFFTTKGVGKGTGQGLAIAHSVVVEKHKGALTVDVERGHGTTFFLRIPRAQGSVEKQPSV